MTGQTLRVRMIWAAGLWTTIASTAQAGIVPKGVRVWDVRSQGGKVSPEAGMLADSVLSDPAAVPVPEAHDYGKKHKRMMDGVPADKRPYVVPGLRPFPPLDPPRPSLAQVVDSCEPVPHPREDETEKEVFERTDVQEPEGPVLYQSLPPRAALHRDDLTQVRIRHVGPSSPPQTRRHGGPLGHASGDL